MRIPRVHTQQVLREGEAVQLEAQASRHLAAVLRMRAEDALYIFNGDGLEYKAKIIEASKNSVRVGIQEPRKTPSLESPLKVSLGIAISKGDKMDWVIQKATELGVSNITPLQSRRVDVKISPERMAKKQGHWQQVAISACEQSGRRIVPTVEDVCKLEKWLSNRDEAKRFVLSPEQTETLSATETVKDIALLIGPEGGLDSIEIEAAIGHGFQGLRIGPRVLRTETAPIAALAILQQLWGDF